MGPRLWAAIGNVLRIFAVLGYLSGALLGYRAIQLNQQGVSGNLITVSVVATVLTFVLAILFWNAKGFLVSGNLIVRVLVGLYMLFWIIGSLGFALIFIGIVYLFTGEPDSSEVYRSVKAPKPRFRAPADWHPTGRVGPSGAMLYPDPQREGAVGVFESSIPVQVTEKRNGLAHVVAASGEAGWIDVRTMTEGV